MTHAFVLFQGAVAEVQNLAAADVIFNLQLTAREETSSNFLSRQTWCGDEVLVVPHGRSHLFETVQYIPWLWHEGTPEWNKAITSVWHPCLLWQVDLRSPVAFGTVTNSTLQQVIQVKTRPDAGAAFSTHVPLKESRLLGVVLGLIWSESLDSHSLWLVVLLFLQAVVRRQSTVSSGLADISLLRALLGDIWEHSNTAKKQHLTARSWTVTVEENPKIKSCFFNLGCFE